MKKLHQVVQATLKTTWLKNWNKMSNAKSTARATTSHQFKHNNRCCLPKLNMWHWVCNSYEMKKTCIIAINYTCLLERVLWGSIEAGGAKEQHLRAWGLILYLFKLSCWRNSSANGFKFQRKSSDYHSSSGRSSWRGWKGKVNNLVLSTAILPFVLRDQRQAWEDLMSVRLWRRSGLRKARSGKRYRRRTS